jgi:hypothetical protein
MARPYPASPAQAPTKWPPINPSRICDQGLLTGCAPMKFAADIAQVPAPMARTPDQDQEVEQEPKGPRAHHQIGGVAAHEGPPRAPPTPPARAQSAQKRAQPRCAGPNGAPWARPGVGTERVGPAHSRSDMNREWVHAVCSAPGGLERRRFSPAWPWASAGG